MNPMRVLVTGGAGFIGSHITEGLLREGHEVVVLDNLEPYYDVDLKRHNIATCRAVGDDQFTFVGGSILDEELVRRTIANHDVEVVYHQAAQAGVRTSVDRPRRVHTVNTTGLLTLLEAAADAGVDRLVHASSSSVYGRDEYLPYDEEHPTNPTSPYGVTKVAAEHYCNVWTDLFGLPCVNLRYFTVYGPRMRPNMAISNFVSRCLNGDPPVIYGDGKQTRDFTYVDDIVEANLDLLETDVADGETMNVGSTGNITIADLASYVVEETGADVDIVYDEKRAADARHTQSDVSKARALIGYEPSTSIREGVSMFIDWYRDNREWYEPLVRDA